LTRPTCKREGAFSYRHIESELSRGDRQFFRFAKEEGQGLVEYALILVLIAIVVIGILSLLGNKVSQVFSSIQ
jgi:pilus assembly protein Flp/PilA